MNNQPENLFEFEVEPLDESQLTESHPLVQAIRRAAKQSGPVMTQDEFKVWLTRQQ